MHVSTSFIVVSQDDEDLLMDRIYDHERRRSASPDSGV